MPKLYAKSLPLDSTHFETGVKLRDLNLHDTFKGFDHESWGAHDVVFATNERGAFKSEAVLKGFGAGSQFIEAMTGKNNIHRDNQRFRVYSFMGDSLREAFEVPSYADRLKIEQAEADEGRRAAGC